MGASENVKTGMMCCPEMSVMNYHHTLRNIPEETRSHTSRRKPKIAFCPNPTAIRYMFRPGRSSSGEAVTKMYRGLFWNNSVTIIQQDVISKEKYNTTCLKRKLYIMKTSLSTAHQQMH